MNSGIESKITESEWEVMRVVWAHGKVTSKEIIDVLQQKMDWKPATTKTFIGRLVKKGMLEAEGEGKRYIYSPKVTEGQSVKSALSELFDNICNKDAGKTIADLISTSIFSHKDIDMLENILNRKKKEAVEEGPCNCVPGQCHCNIHQHNHHH